MTDQDFNFATTILTSKTPQQAAAIIPNVITGSTGLNKDLITWFKHYSSTLENYTQGLQQLIDEATKIAERSSIGFNNFPRNWNCLVNAVKTEHDNNEAVNKHLRQEIINPLRELIEKDVRISELMINGQELQEISGNLNREGEIQWNYKAPQSFQNLEDFKKIEIQVMFDIILNFFQLNNGKLTKDLKNNENSTNYLLGSFKLDAEMQNQLNYLVNTQFATPQRGLQQQGQHLAPAAVPNNKQRRNSSFAKLEKSASPKKPSKLKSKVGSIFGRKKKKEKFTGADSIAEDESLSEVSLPPTRTRNSSVLSRSNSTRRSFIDRFHRDESSTGISRQHEQHQQPLSDPLPHAEKPQPEIPQSPEAPQAKSLEPVSEVQKELFPPMQNGSERKGENQQSRVDVPSQTLSPVTPTHDGFGGSVKPLPEPVDSPNVIKYNDSDDSSTEERRGSLLEKHNLEVQPVSSPFTTQPPAPVPQESRSRQSSDGIYSFEAGDDSNPISATPRSEQNVFGQMPDPNLSPEKTLAPPPPPSRKVLHHEEPTVRDSALFHNLPAASHSGRDSVMAPLASQDTGHSLLKNDFKHENLASTLGLSSSIAEVINASFKDGQLIKSQVVGEVAFNYNGNASDPLVVTIPNSFDKVLVNKTFIKDLGQSKYKVNPTSITSKTLGGLKYLLKPTQVPVIIQQIWKFEPHQSSLMVSIRSTTPLVLENFVVSVALNQDIEATSASSKPQGAFNKEKNRITWRYPQSLALNGEERLIARFMTNGLGSEHESGVQIKFQVKDPQVKYCSIYSENGEEIPTFRNLVSGSYSGHL